MLVVWLISQSLSQSKILYFNKHAPYRNMLQPKVVQETLFRATWRLFIPWLVCTRI